MMYDEELDELDCESEDEYCLNKEELISHMDSLCRATEEGKILWKVTSYTPIFFFLSNPFVEDSRAVVSQQLTVAGEFHGQGLIYEVREEIHLPSGMADFEVKEVLPGTGYITSLSDESAYEFLTNQQQMLKKYKEHPIMRFVSAVMAQSGSTDFHSLLTRRTYSFSAEAIPRRFTRLPLVKRCKELYEKCDAMAFHALTLNDSLRDGLGLID